MRCKNCGWNNPSERMVCEKCNSSLGVSEISEDGKRKTIRESSSVKLKNLGVGEDVESADRENSICENCGYPIMSGGQYCPQCGTDVVKAPSMPSSDNNERKTILPSRRSCCTLIMVAEPGEKLSDDNALLSFSGNEIILNRGNTEPKNNTITSREQAIITCENRKWYIQDKSELQTTFIRPGEKTEIKDGDIILLGDRRFRFNS